MWQDVDRSIGLDREAELVEEHWAGMLKGGSQRVRFENTTRSAWNILNRVIPPEKQLAPSKIPSNMKQSTVSSTTEDHCRSLILPILEDKRQKKLIGKLTGGDAQNMVDFLNIVGDEHLHFLVVWFHLVELDPSQTRAFFTFVGTWSAPS